MDLEQYFKAFNYKIEKWTIRSRLIVQFLVMIVIVLSVFLSTVYLSVLASLGVIIFAYLLVYLLIDYWVQLLARQIGINSYLPIVVKTNLDLNSGHFLVLVLILLIPFCLFFVASSPPPDYFVVFIYDLVAAFIYSLFLRTDLSPHWTFKELEKRLAQNNKVDLRNRWIAATNYFTLSRNFKHPNMDQIFNSLNHYYPFLSSKEKSEVRKDIENRINSLLNSDNLDLKEVHSTQFILGSPISEYQSLLPSKNKLVDRLSKLLTFLIEEILVPTSKKIGPSLIALILSILIVKLVDQTTLEQAKSILSTFLK